MANHHLGRRDVLVLAGLASLSSIRPQALVSEALASPLEGQTMTATSKQNLESRRRELYELLGDLPDRRRPIGGKKRKEEFVKASRDPALVKRLTDNGIPGAATTPG